jgi:cation:H+ antiporter
MIATLLPSGWFADQAMWVLIVVAVLGMAIVIKGADWLVEGAAGLAGRLGMPKIVIGATIVSLGTTSPEMAVSVLAAWAGKAGLALGNGVGSIIADTGLIFGIGCLMARGLPADRFILKRQGWVQVGSATFLAAVCYLLYIGQGDAAAIGRPMGLLLTAALGAYLWISVRWSKQHAVAQDGVASEEVDVDEAARKPLMTLVGVGLLGLAMVIFAGDALVQSVTLVAEDVGVPEVVIASTIVALGTSLPELIVGLTAVWKGHPALLVGNVIGADILNVLFVIGFAALARPLPIIDPTATYPAIFLMLQLPTMLAMLWLFRLYIRRASRKGCFDRWMGAPLVAMYVGFVIASALLS